MRYAKRHLMEPEAKRIEKVPHGRLGLEFFLPKGPHPHARSQRPKAGGPAVRVPARLASLHTVVAVLKDDARQLVMPPALRLRSLTDGQPVELVSFLAQTARCIKIVNTGDVATNWWSIAEFTVYD
ncbi:hypothetical protein [Streptomyces sp. NPDC054804]